MKISSLYLALLTTSSYLVDHVLAFDVSITCTAEGDDCHGLKQNNVCDENESDIVPAAVTVRFCEVDGSALDTSEGSATQILVRGEAVSRVYNGKVVIEASNIDTVLVGDCLVHEFQINVDKCGSHFNVKATGLLEDGTEGFGYESFMRQNCDLETSVTCTLADGSDCTTMSTCNATETTSVTYEFCYRTSYTDRTITIRENYDPNTSVEKLPANCVGGDCKESHASIGRGFDAARFFDRFPPADGMRIGFGYSNEECWSKTHTLGNCEYIPQAFVNVVGEVTRKQEGSGGAPLTDYKACFSRSMFPEYEIGSSTMKKKSKVKGTMAPKGTKSPAGKGTKSPAGKGTMAPKGTKSPAGKGTKSPGTSRRNTRERSLRH